jgi:hypothetical protein
MSVKTCSALCGSMAYAPPVAGPPPALLKALSQASVTPTVAASFVKYSRAMPPTERGSPMSTALRPPLVMPPRCLPGSAMITDFPMRAACTAAATPPLVPP